MNMLGAPKYTVNMLPLGLGDPGFFGDSLQLEPSCVAFFLEFAGGAVVVA
jgi:hypothetical protein